MATHWRRSKVFVALLEIAREYDVPLIIHSEYSAITPTLAICQENRDNRFLLAHAGAVIRPKQIENIFEYRMDEGYWANETPDLTAWFK